jgi:hypothetical protein
LFLEAANKRSEGVSVSRLFIYDLQPKEIVSDYRTQIEHLTLDMNDSRNVHKILSLPMPENIELKYLRITGSILQETLLLISSHITNIVELPIINYKPFPENTLKTIHRILNSKSIQNLQYSNSSSNLLLNSLSAVHTNRKSFRKFFKSAITVYSGSSRG